MSVAINEEGADSKAAATHRLARRHRSNPADRPVTAAPIGAFGPAKPAFPRILA